MELTAEINEMEGNKFIWGFIKPHLLTGEVVHATLLREHASL